MKNPTRLLCDEELTLREIENFNKNNKKLQEVNHVP